MKKNKVGIIIFITILFLILCSIPITEYIKQIPYYKVKMYGEPIDLETGMVNNAYFNIYADGTQIAETTAGINEAIEYAFNNNIEYVQFEKGTYIVKAFGDEDKRGVCLKSNMHVNFNGATIKEPRTARTHYSIINIYQVKNVKISNAIILGDKDDHKYEGTTTHEWGFGVDIRGSQNIEIYNLKISNTTGDGIYIARANNQTTENVKIDSCHISDCRRQGISIICGKDIEIMNSEICDIRGTNPQSGICIESNNAEEVIDNVKIHNNIIYNSAKKLAIHVYQGLYNIEVYDNKIYGDISFKDLRETAKVYQNTLYNGKIIGYLDESLINRGHQLNEITISENSYTNYNIQVDTFEKKQIID
ncbi:MAG: right-handed parallel beta-helix repeat-containing protein [Clostridia bacterium]